MERVCLILKNEGIDGMEERAFETVRALSKHGYFFGEIRILDLGQKRSLQTLFTALKTEFDQIFCIGTEAVEKTVLENLSSLYPQMLYNDPANGAFVFFEKNKTAIFLKIGQTDIPSALLTELYKKDSIRKERTTIRCMGANETHIKRLLLDCRQKYGEKIRFAHRRKYDEDVVQLFYGEDVSKIMLDDTVRVLAENLGDTLYALEDAELEEQLVSLLKIRGKKLSVAESFTGGGISKRIVSVSGASEVFYEGLNTYDEHSKMQRLGVNEFTLKSFGAVSEKTAYEMALGLLQTGKTDLAIATTGLAGPKSDRSMLPVGLSFIAVGTKERIFVYRYKFDGSRKEITEKAINYALFLAYKHLKNL